MTQKSKQLLALALAVCSFAVLIVSAILGIRWVALDQPGRPPSIETVANSKPSTFPEITGHVTDAVTHQPITRFEIIQGAQFPNSTSPWFHGTKSFSDGNYRLSLNGFGGDIKAHYLRVEADNYRPAISPPLHESCSLDFALEPAPDWIGHVLTPDGRPAAGVKVALIWNEPIVIFQNGKLNSDVIIHNPMTTASDGSFQIHPQIDSFELWAWSDAGVAHLQGPKPNDEKLDMNLRPWATLRLKIPWAAENKSPLTIIAKSPAHPVERRWLYSTTPSPDGTVIIDRLPPMEAGIVEVQLARTKPRWESGPTLLTNLTPGQTTDLDLTRGVTVTGHVSGDDPFLSLTPLPDKPVGQLPPDWLAAAKLMPPVFAYVAKFDDSGHFTIEAVRPGKYAYLSSSNRSTSGLQGTGLLSIAAGGDHSVQDVGELPVSKVVRIHQGEAAPAVLGRTLDDQPILTADFHGKFVVCVVLDSTARSEAALSYLADLGKEFAGNPRVALVAINADLQIGGIPRCPPKIGLGWEDGYFSTIDFALFSALPGSPNWPPIFILNPQGSVVATGLSVEETAPRLNGLLKGLIP